MSIDLNAEGAKSELALGPNSAVQRPATVLTDLRRFTGKMFLLKRGAVLYFPVLAAAGALPQLFLWYLGKVIECGAKPCEAYLLDVFSTPIGISGEGLVVLAALAAFMRISAWVLFELWGQWSSRTMFNDMVAGLARVRVTFFDSNPSGRLLNRFSGDYDGLRYIGVIRIGDTLNAFFEVLFLAGLASLTSWWPLALLAPVLWIFVRLQTQVAPLQHHAGTVAQERLGEWIHRETDVIDGLPVFRLYGRMHGLLERLRDAYQQKITAKLFQAQVTAWGHFWVGATTLGFATVIVGVAGASLAHGVAGHALGAMLLTLAFRAMPTFRWMMWASSDLSETAANARRVFEITDLRDESEEEFSSGQAARVTPFAGGHEEWLGDIQFRGYSAGYFTGSPDVFCDLNLTIKGGVRTGIVGRSGSGKSSLVQALFRMLEVRGGDISIGGKSILSLRQSEARSHFAVVPQFPLLFDGTLRENLDPWGTTPDEKLLNTLRRSGLARALDVKVGEGGALLSQGERQLICLARALLQDKPIVLLDEPTSAIDPVADAQIQKVLESEFRGRTVITIAHRVETLARYDAVIDLEAVRK